MNLNYKPINSKLYDRVIHLLPDRNKVVSDKIEFNIDGVGVHFEWCSLNKWVLLNPLMIEPRNNKVKVKEKCRKCGNVEHTINKEATRVRCDSCKLITDIKV